MLYANERQAILEGSLTFVEPFGYLSRSFLSNGYYPYLRPIGDAELDQFIAENKQATLDRFDAAMRQRAADGDPAAAQLSASDLGR